MRPYIPSVWDPNRIGARVRRWRAWGVTRQGLRVETEFTSIVQGVDGVARAEFREAFHDAILLGTERADLEEHHE